MKILRGATKIFRHPKGGALKKLGGGSENLSVYFKTNRRGGGGLLKN